ncbi:hypothetical protein RJT34_25234 [Clitoria ternatea]|uniref:Uncharacterized protein n=1 Tax=Clitoria ternatea TaxID=43366 RepID=A0AAN9FPE6_CLITE
MGCAYLLTPSIDLQGFKRRIEGVGIEHDKRNNQIPNLGSALTLGFFTNGMAMVVKIDVCPLPRWQHHCSTTHAPTLATTISATSAAMTSTLEPSLATNLRNAILPSSFGQSDLCFVIAILSIAQDCDAISLCSGRLPPLLRRGAFLQS